MRTESASPLPGLALHPDCGWPLPARHPQVSSAPRRTPAQGTNAHRVTWLSCSSSSVGSAERRTTQDETGLTFPLQLPLRFLLPAGPAPQDGWDARALAPWGGRL